MRIITGVLKSRLFKSPPGNRTHPMGERVRAGLFNVLGDIEGLSVLDGFAGSGSLAFESISRGASRAVVIDSDKRAYKTLVDNIEALDLNQQVHATRANSATWAKNSDQMFDLVFVDPPYYDVNPLHIRALSERVEIGGLLVLSYPSVYKPRLAEPQWVRVSQKSYANANIAIFKRMR